MVPLTNLVQCLKPLGPVGLDQRMMMEGKPPPMGAARQLGNRTDKQTRDRHTANQEFIAKSLVYYK